MISFPPRTRMLRSRGFPFLKERTYVQEVPFGNPRFTGSLRLPGAFRSLARPSSAPEPSHSPNSGVSRKLSAQHTSRLHMIVVTEPCTTRRTPLQGSRPFPYDVSRHRGCTGSPRGPRQGCPRGHCPLSVSGSKRRRRAIFNGSGLAPEGRRRPRTPAPSARGVGRWIREG